MSGLNLTRELVEDTHNKAGNHLLNMPDDVGAQEYFCYSTDWLAMYDLLCGEYGVLDVIGNTIVNIQDLKYPSEGIKIDQSELIELGKKIRALIGGGE